jgi:hypothetical protein
MEDEDREVVDNLSFAVIAHTQAVMRRNQALKDRCGGFVQIDLVALLRSRWHSGAMPALPSGRGASSSLVKRLPTFTVHDFIHPSHWLEASDSVQPTPETTDECSYR